MGSTISTKRIAKNTLFMYIRMCITMLVQLYASRVVLNCLGIDDYGIYNIVGSFIVAFTFISGPLGTATQRFLTYKIGTNEKEGVISIFNMSLICYVCLSMMLVFVIEFVGPWFIKTHMSFPEGRIDVVLLTFQASVAVLVFRMLKIPFEALIIAYERMSFYAYFSIVEAVLMLCNAISLIYYPYEKLILFSINQMFIVIISVLGFAIYCFKVFDIFRYAFKWNNSLFKELINFSGWTLFGSLSSMSANHGLNILLNIFYGVVVNAAMGIANQVSFGVSHFVNSFQVAFRPQLVKCFAQGEKQILHRLICETSKFSYLMLFAIICPLCFNMSFVINLWLGHTPNYASEFCVLMLVYVLLESLSAPLWMTIQATGNIRNYQIVISVLMSLNLVLSYVFLSLGHSPYSVLIIKCILDLLCLIARLRFVHFMTQFSIINFCKKVIFPILLISLTEVVVMYFTTRLFDIGCRRLLFSSALFLVTYLPLVYIYGMDAKSRTWFRNLVMNFVNN